MSDKDNKDNKDNKVLLLLEEDDLINAFGFFASEVMEIMEDHFDGFHVMDNERASKATAKGVVGSIQNIMKILKEKSIENE